MGINPCLLMRPTFGLSPTTPFLLDGPRIEPSVSVPMAAAQKPAATATADPELEPQGFLKGS